MSITGIGATNIDLLYSGIKKLPDVGEEIYSNKFDVQIGGGTVGTLINISRLGIETNIITMLGNDIFSNFVKQEFEANNIKLNNIINDNVEFPLNVTSAMILPNDRSFMSYGAGTIQYSQKTENSLLSAADKSKIVLMQTDGFLDTYRKLKNKGAILVLDVGWSDDLTLDKIKEYLEIADFFTPNQKEALKITGCKNVYDAATCLNRYIDKVIVKLDNDGCLGYDGEFFKIPCIEDTVCIDSTGAGDAFLAGFCYGLYHDYTFRDCLLLGNITGAKAVTKIGALSAYYNEEELINKFDEIKRA